MRTIETRQKADLLFSSSGSKLLGIGASVSPGPAEIDGYAAVTVLILSDQPFVVNFFEGEIPSGPFIMTQSFTSSSSSGQQSGPFPNFPAGPGFMVAQRFQTIGAFLKMTISNTGTSPETVLDFSVRGLAVP